MINQSIFQYLLRGGMWAFLGKLITSLMSFLLAAVLARLLTPAHMATFFLANSIALFLALTGRFGLDNTLLRLVSESIALDERSRAKSIIFVGISLVAGISTGLACFIYFGPGSWALSLLFPNQQLNLIVGFIAIWSVTLSFQFLLGEIFRSLREINLAVTIGGALSAILTVSLLFTLLHFTHDTSTLSMVLSIITIASSLNMIAGVAILYGRLKKTKTSNNSIPIKVSELFQNCWPFWLNGMTHYMLSFAGLWILGIFTTGIDIANYGAANRLVILAGLSLIIVNSVIPPLIANLNVQGKHKQLELILRGTATLASLPAIIIIIILFLFAEPIMSFTFGPSYKAGSHILQILLLSQLTSVLSGSCGYLLMMSGHQKVMMRITLFSAIILISLGLLIAKPFGITGIAWVTTLTITIQQLTTVFLAHNMTGVWSCVSYRHAKKIIKENLLKA